MFTFREFVTEWLRMLLPLPKASSKLAVTSGKQFVVKFSRQNISYYTHIDLINVSKYTIYTLWKKYRLYHTTFSKTKQANIHFITSL